MREILFRGKRLGDSEWIDGSLFIDDKKEKHEILIGYVNYRIGWEVDPKTVGQYTGLKDKNGERIFEGDIMRFTAYDILYTGTVKFAEGSFYVNCKKCKPVFLDSAVGTHDALKIGNIHDNPELLEE